MITHDQTAVQSLTAQIAAAASADGSRAERESRFAILSTFRQGDLVTDITVELGGRYRAVVNTDPRHVRQLSVDAVKPLLGQPTVT